MENAVDALYMAFAVIAFVIALSLSIFAFTNVTTASQRIIDNRDKTSMYEYVEPEGTERTVTAEDIIPTLYRAYYENYMVRFEGFGDLYKVKNEGADSEQNPYKGTNIIDLEGQKIGNHIDADKLITALLQGNFENLDKNRYNYFNFDRSPLQNKGLYVKIKEKATIKEKIGLYYMEDESNYSEETSENIEDVNKTKKRIITYSSIE
ncbi:MAG: hypothetical protein IKF83_03010 [Clostridia bacterium]|nr:hypothetical protein [Clostridia bacterium]